MSQAQNSGSLIDQGKKVTGRPTKRTPEIVQSILNALSTGKPLTHICAELGVSDTSVRNWMEDDEQLSCDFADARARGFDAIALEALQIADNSTNDTMLTDDGGEIPNKEWMARSKLRVDTRLKLLAKWDPKRYGDKPDIIVNNNNTNAAQTVVSLQPDQEASLQTLIQQTRERIRK